MAAPLSCFTAYDVRGRLPDELNSDIVRRIGLAFADQFGMRRVVVGRDMRLSSPELAQALVEVLTSQGIDVVDIGLCGTEEVYFTVFAGEKEGIDGGIMVTASHNPADYNGMKLVQRGARPVSRDSGLDAVAEKAASESWFADMQAHFSGRPGTCIRAEDKSAYIDHLLSYVDVSALPPLKLLVNPGNGCAGPVVDLLAEKLPFEFVRLYWEPDGTFPNGVPNPLLPEKREATARAVREHGADLGIAWDGDFDRCFFYDHTGRFIEGYYMVGLLAVAMLARHPGATILHDPRLVWNTIEMVTEAGGFPVMTKTGHAFIKERMRELDAVYGGEMSAHHYFRDFGYCDSGMIPWLLVAQLMGRSGTPLADMVDARMERYPVSGEINSRVSDPDAVIARVEERYGDGEKDYTDGLSVSYPRYRFNLRKSNTEPVLRLNVETRGDRALLREKTDELLALIRS
ncbi:phosphohexose mutases [Desulfolithobacter dissulfuricans]|uniref:Phosphohexose mutases n=1 Tax=Desulfolithobacter dissulfuricans TaxID=2795293 RepID=A0A915XIL5_9BACT|nr:phosphomannomutase [Desulfolithobacter dissulfuricans]BCO07722.1 phosphohexose mutases [Desulfolithobacter dissulfuricans]